MPSKLIGDCIYSWEVVRAFSNDWILRRMVGQYQQPDSLYATRSAAEQAGREWLEAKVEAHG